MKDVQAGIIQKTEILCVLKKLGEKLNDDEEIFLNSNMHNNMKQFELASTNIGLFKNIFLELIFSII